MPFFCPLMARQESIKDLLIQGNRMMKQMQGQMTLAGAASDANKLRGTRTRPRSSP